MKSQLCWSCKSKNCPWRQSLKPVEGWTAKPTVTEDGLKSYCITKCPLYERWEKQPEEELFVHQNDFWDIAEVKQDILAKLPQKYQDILTARFVEHRTFSEICKKFEMTSNASVADVLHKAIDLYDEAKYKAMGFNISLSRKPIKHLNQAAIRRCPPKIQKVLTLRYVEKFSRAELCTTFGIGDGAMGKLLHRTKRCYYSELVKLKTGEVEQ